MRPFPQLVGRRGGNWITHSPKFPFIAERDLGEAGLKVMCDYGAKEFSAGSCDLVNFDCMSNEVGFIEEYMRSQHPAVKYAIGSTNARLEIERQHWHKERARATTDTDEG